MDAMNSTDDPLSHASLSEIWGVIWLRYIAAMGFVVLIYDTLLTLDDEMRLVWPGPLSLPKSLYFINRYLSIIITLYANYQISGLHPPLTDHLSVSLHAPIDMSCQIVNWVTGIAFVVRTTAATAMLCLRVAALYNDVRWVFWSVWICFVIFHGIRAILAILGMILVALGAKYSLISSQCLQESGARFHSSGPSILAVITPTTLDLYLLVLTIVKASRSDVLSKSHPSSPIMRALLRHEVLYFIILTIVRSWVTIVVIVFPRSWMNMASNAEWGVESTLISRFFLNLRAICYYGQTTAANQTVVSTMTSPIRTHPFWRRPRQFTTTFSFRFGTGARTYGDLATRTERGIPHTETVDLESVMVLSTRQDENKDDIRLDVVTMDKK